ncbi:MAG: integrase core domain-containing protein, partial [Solirubrobacteraceae bacterium]
RQRRRLPLDRARDRLPGDEDQAHPHPALPPPHQRQGRALIRTMLGGWAYGAIYSSSAERTAALSGWLTVYNWSRPHGSLAKKPPGTRLAELNNVVGSYT